MKSYLPGWLLFMVTLLGIFPARAYDFQVGGIYYNLNGEEVTVTYGSDKYSSSYSGDVVIPSTVTYESRTYLVTSIGDGAFSYCSGLTSITIPESVTSIGDETFFWCIGLISVTIPASVERLGPGVFSGCTNLEEIIVSADNPVYSSLDGVLYNKDKTELVKWPDKKLSVTILESVTSIGDWAFYYCSGLTSITIPESVTSIGDLAFYSCIGLTSIIIPESVTSIGDMAFSYCRGLTSVMIPVSVERLGIGVFSGCTNLEEIIVSADNPVYSSLDGVLYNKDKTELLKWPDKKLSVTIPESVTSIGESAFEDCYGLTTITLPESVTSIGDRAFSYCISLTSMTIPESVEIIGNSAFYGCTGLTTITLPESLTSIGESTFLGCTGLTTITLPESLTSIGESTFLGCSGLTSITLPESLTSIGEATFANCNQLESVTVHAVTPPEIGPNTFDNYGIPLYVPAGCKEAYQAAKYWRYFMNIQEMESSVETVLDSGACIYVENHTLHVENVDGDYWVYTITGRLVYAGHVATVQLADAGVYVVRTSSLSQKVMVK